jgi:hypothetical protein
MPSPGPILFALVTLALLYSTASVAFGGVIAGVIAAASALMAPLLWTQLAALPPALYAIPCVCGWLLAIAMLSATRRWWWAAVGGAALAAGAYTSAPALVMMPCYAALTVCVLAPARSVARQALAVFVAAFVLGSMPLLIRWMLQPQAFRDLVNAHHLYDANRFNVLQGVREVTSWVGLTARSEVYWDYLNPVFLFVTGRVLAWPLVILLPLGLYYALVKDSTAVARLALIGYLVAPLAGSLTAEPPMASRIIWIIPFASLLAACAAAHLQRRTSLRPS